MHCWKCGCYLPFGLRRNHCPRCQWNPEAIPRTEERLELDEYGRIKRAVLDRLYGISTSPYVDVYYRRD